MIVQRGMLGPQERLRRVISLLGESRRPRTLSVQIPRDTQIEQLSWQFEDGSNKPILSCTREELVVVIKGLVSAIKERDYPSEPIISNQ